MRAASPPAAVQCTIHQPSLDIFEVGGGPGGCPGGCSSCLRRRMGGAGSQLPSKALCLHASRPRPWPLHSPTPLSLQAFDELLLLKPGGRTIYSGPMGDSSERLIAYFQGIPGVKPIKPRCGRAARRGCSGSAVRLLAGLWSGGCVLESEEILSTRSSRQSPPCLPPPPALSDGWAHSGLTLDAET